MHEKRSKAETLSGESRETYEELSEMDNDTDILCTILAETKLRNQDREMHTDTSSGKYNIESDGES